MIFRVEIGNFDLPMPFLRNWDAVPEEPRLIHHETGSCRVDEGNPLVGIAFFDETRADAGLLEG